MKTKFIAMLLMLSAAGAAMAQEATIKVAADSSSGTYQKMLGEIIQQCNGIDITVAQGVTGGAPGNLDALVNNKAQAAFMHSDVFLANSMADASYAKFQTLIALYPEPIHVIVLRESKTSKNGTFTFGKASFNSLQDVAGYKIGAAGGGVYTARFLQSQGQGGFEVESYNTGSDVIKALDTGEIAAAIFVGAAPLPNLEKLDGNKYKLVPIGEQIASRVATLYRPAKISGYRGLQSGPVATLAPLAVIMTRKYSTPAKVQAQAAFRSCFNKALPALQDEGSPNWQTVEANDHGTLPWYELPTVEATAKRK